MMSRFTHLGIAPVSISFNDWLFTLRVFLSCKYANTREARAKSIPKMPKVIGWIEELLLEGAFVLKTMEV
jgi:hypothetical protein